MQRFKLTLSLLSVFTLGLCASWANAGGSNGGGGYSVKCLDGKFYAMDYVATQKTASGIDPGNVEAKDSMEILARIEKHLEVIRPELAASLKDFMLMNDKEANTETSRLWNDGIHPLEKLTDAQRIRDLKSCLGENTDADVFQAVIRRQFKGGIVYSRDPDQLRHLEATGPLQVSFTYVHEWLRDYTEDSNIIMEVNYFLHSTEFLKMNASRFETVMRRHGLENLPGAEAREATKMSPFTALKVSWDGMVHYHSEGTVGLAIYLCPAPVTIYHKRWTEVANEEPDVSACRLIRHVEPRAVPEMYWYQRTVFTPALTSTYEPFTLFIQGAEINSMNEGLSHTDGAGGPYLTAMLEIQSGDNYMRADQNFDLSLASNQKNLQSETCGMLIGGCTKGVDLEVIKTVPVGDHGHGPGYFTHVRLEVVNLVAH